MCFHDVSKEHQSRTQVKEIHQPESDNEPASQKFSYVIINALNIVIALPVLETLRSSIHRSWGKIIDRYRQKSSMELNKSTDANSALVESETRYQSLMKTSLDGIHIMDIDGNLLEANDAFCRMLGYTQEEVMHLNVTDLVGEFATEELRSAFKRDFGISRVIETIHRRKDGTLLNVEISISNMMLDGRYYIFASSRDIT